MCKTALSTEELGADPQMGEKMKLTDSHTMVIKIGSALLIDEEQQSVHTKWLISLIDDIAKLIKQGIKVILVSSGAIAYGKISLGLTSKHLTLDGKQAASAVGQIHLMQTYHALLSEQGIKAAQILLTISDSENRGRFLNLRNTLYKLLKLGVVPIINENDSVATSEIRYGDNDRLAARVAQMVDADTLVLLSDIDGFYSDDPRKNNNAKLIPVIEKLTPDIIAMAKVSSSNYGSGGMITKLDAAKIATSSGCRMLITAGKHMHPLQHFIDTNQGTWFLSDTTPTSAKKNWLREHLKTDGKVFIDAGAANALQNGASLLPVGVTDCDGDFQKGSAVSIMTETEQEIARGLVNYSAHEVKKLLGQPSQKIAHILGYDGCDEIVHRDNLSLL